MLLGYFLDVHAALGTGHDERARRFAVEQDGEIKFLFDFRAGGEQQRLHLAAFRAGLFGHQNIAEHFFGKAHGFVHRAGDFHAALKTGFERAFAASAGVDLRFDDDFGAAAGGDFFRRRAHFGEGFGGNFKRDRDAILGEQLFGLVFVDIHFKKLIHALKTIAAGNQTF